MNTQKKKYEAPKYEVVRFDSQIVTQQTGQDCMEIHSWLSGTDCHEQELYLPQS